MADHLAQLVLEGQDGGGAEYQERDHDVERPGRRDQQEDAARDGADHGGRDRQDPQQPRGVRGSSARLPTTLETYPGKTGRGVGDVGGPSAPRPVASRAGNVISEPPPAIALTLPASHDAMRRAASCARQAMRTGRPGRGRDRLPGQSRPCGDIQYAGPTTTPATSSPPRRRRVASRDIDQLHRNAAMATPAVVGVMPGVPCTGRTSRPGGRVGAVWGPPPRNVRTPQGRVVANGNPGDPRDSATENRPPAPCAQVRVKRWGKSPPAPRVTGVAR